MRAVRDLRSLQTTAEPILQNGCIHPQLRVGTLVWHEDHGVGHILGWRHHGVLEGEPVDVEADNTASIEFEMQSAQGGGLVLLMLPLVEVTFLPANVLRSPELGLRVRRGLDWDWGDQDGGAGMLGITVAEGRVDLGWVNVRWDHGDGNSYRVGADGKYDLMVVPEGTRNAPDVKVSFVVAGAGGEAINGRYVLVDTQNGRPRYKLEHGQAVMFFQEKWKIAEREGATAWLYQHPAATSSPPTGPWTVVGDDPGPPPLVFDESEDDILRGPEVGLRVRRGPDWEWQDQDDGGLGITVDIEARLGWVAVRWDHGVENKYRVGADGKYDLIVVGRSMSFEARAPSVASGSGAWPVRVTGAGGVGESINGWFVQDGMLHGKPRYRQREGTAIIYFSGQWKINDEDDLGGWFYCHHDSAASYPPNGFWSTDGYTGLDADPAPVVGVYETGSYEPQVISELGAPIIGLRVARGPQWCWGDQDGGRLGMTVERGSATEGWVGVRWDNGNENNYRVGAENAYDLVAVSHLRLSHAGGRGSQVNGRYVPTETFNGRPKFRQINGSGIIYYDSFWKINFHDDTGGWYYSHPLPNVVPPIGDWTTQGYGGEDADPAPLLMRSFDVGNLVKFVNLDEELWDACPMPRLSPSLGSAYNIAQIQDEWFQDRSSHWGPLRAVELSHEMGTEPPVDWTPAGYDETWVSAEEAEKSKCPICFMVARNALAHECGELFCEDCWVKCQGEDERCPVCRQEGHEVAPAYANRRAIQRLQIVCPNKCGQVLCLSDKEDHLRSKCGHRPIRCPDCDSEVAAGQLAEHQVLCRENWPICELCGQRVKNLAVHMAAQTGDHMLRMVEGLASLREEVKDLRTQNKALQTRLCKDGEPQDFF